MFTYWEYNKKTKKTEIILYKNILSNTLQVKFEDIKHNYNLFPPHINTYNLLETLKKYTLFIINFKYEKNDNYFSLINKIQSEINGEIILNFEKPIIQLKKNNSKVSLNNIFFIKLSEINSIYFKFKIL